MAKWSTARSAPTYPNFAPSAEPATRRSARNQCKHVVLTKCFTLDVRLVETIFMCICCVSYVSWVSGEWEECSKSCGKSGTHTRPVRCVRAELDGSYKAINAKYCNDDRPEGRRACNRHLCPAQWRTGPWSQVGMWV